MLDYTSHCLIQLDSIIKDVYCYNIQSASKNDHGEQGRLLAKVPKKKKIINITKNVL